MKRADKRENKKNNGITLIALVITIIVLLILAGVTIATLTGENGILTRATEASEQTRQASAEEEVQLAVTGSIGTDGEIDPDLLTKNLENVGGLTSGLPIDSLPAIVEVDGNEIAIGANGSVGAVIRMEEYQTEDTKPYLPGADFNQVLGTNLENGLVVTDGTNYWTWVEVPISIYTTATSETDYEAIENDMKKYTTTLPTGSVHGYTDIWYDRYGVTYDGVNEYSPIIYTVYVNSNIEEIKKYYGKLYLDEKGETEASNYAFGTTYYVKIIDKLDDTTGCGLTYEEYNNLKRNMLSSLYRNGGFWIGQYEAGTSTYPATEQNDSRTLVIRKGAYPYNYITCSNAQKKSNDINSGIYTSSLIFGLQWDLTLTYIQKKDEATIEELTVDSKEWGNYKNSPMFQIDNGEYTTTPSAEQSFIIYSENTQGYVEESNKLENNRVLLTTGSTERNMKMNIYDLAGNLSEWTLGRAEWASIQQPCSWRGGSFSNDGNYSAAYSSGYQTDTANPYYGFRLTLY